MSDYEKRKEIGDKYLRGTGIEIGAGLVVIDYAHIDRLVVADKRDDAEFKALFGQASPLQLHSLATAAEKFPNGCDFLLAHQVFEHCANPIRILCAEWIPLLKDGGILFLGVPSNDNACERNRPITPLEHILDDFYFSRNEHNYESVQHIFSFILQWTTMNPETFWYAKQGIQSFCEIALAEGRSPNPDLHWHTYTLATAAATVEASFYAAGVGLDWLHYEQTEDCIYLVCRKTSERRLPACLIEYRERLITASRSI